MHPGPVLITGANGGIGLATAIEAGRRGWDVCGVVRSEVGAATVRSRMEAAGLEVDVEIADVTDGARIAEVVKKVEPYALINVAGGAKPGAIEDMDVDEGAGLMELMAVAPMRLCKAALPHMKQLGGGRIVNVSSLAGRTSAPLVGWYVASKHALETLTDALRMELRGDRIGVSLVEPGGVDTKLFADATESAPEHSRFIKGYKRAERAAKLTHAFRNNPDSVARVIMDAVESPKPRPRYIVGLDARLLILVGKVLPLGVRDRLKRKVLAL